ncbi:universal stress protein [Planomicrobium sp. CPCC 101110]|uniref:universal stress protein n=1 Tax=Planomicrobium sp. CPCC 101110 TaxID=2599619 RepID=UPI0011B55C75|nr:universal stress protein [Planomicrobium sp. CPCC 101110]TWT27155.1 universal stress protein [Planomicrobium sp. CPCC 101110]
MTLKYSQIIVAVDGSDQAAIAFKKAVDIAVRNNATLNLVSIVDNRSFGSIEAYGQAFAKGAKTAAEGLLTTYKEVATEAGVPQVNSIVEYGSPKSMIPVDMVKRLDADLIVCGATGLNSAERFLMGSVSERIVRSARCDVLVVRTPVIEAKGKPVE